MNWSYRVLFLSEPQGGQAQADAISEMNEKGADGWELVTVLAKPNGWWMFYKKPESE